MQKKRILSVTIKRMIDDSPDTSWLGEYGNKAESEYAIDRGHTVECPVNNKPVDVIDKLERIISHIDKLRVEAGQDPENTEWESLDESIDALIALQDELAKCDCYKGGSRDSRSYQYFNPCHENYLGEDPEDIRKYTRQDYERMENLDNGYWCFMGVSAVAEIAIPDKTCIGNQSYHLVQHIHSGGLWGLESDMPACDWEENETEQLAELKDQLKSFGFSSRAISTAFKTIERKED